MTKGDKILLAALTCLTLLSAALLYGRFFLPKESTRARQAVVSVRGEVVRRIDLPSSGKSSFQVQGRVGPSMVEVDGARVSMREAPCAGGICVKQGWIEHPGQSIACVPGEILVRIEGAALLDAVTR